MFARFNAEKPQYRACDTLGSKCHPRIKQWRTAIARLRHLSGAQQLAAVNREVNILVRYGSDIRTQGKADIWSTPYETLRGSGDCEDYAILKYATLEELGVSNDRMKIVVVKDTVRRIGHAVLAVRTDNQIDILDNLSNEPVNQAQVTRYQPLYSVNRNGRWLNLKVRKRTIAVASLSPQP